MSRRIDSSSTPILPWIVANNCFVRFGLVLFKSVFSTATVGYDQQRWHSPFTPTPRSCHQRRRLLLFSQARGCSQQQSPHLVELAHCTLLNRLFHNLLQLRALHILQMMSLSTWPWCKLEHRPDQMPFSYPLRIEGSPFARMNALPRCRLWTVERSNEFELVLVWIAGSPKKQISV